jgi:2-amino-4-hydroxy-6-hydroxymethyldihydropteridine diphosphokinase
VIRVTGVFLALGANLGDRLAALQSAVDLLAERGVRTVASSRVWATAPAGGPAEQPEFLNAVIEIDPDALEPDDVLAAAHEVEAALGRVRAERWGPRTIDIDVLLWGDRMNEDPTLTIPHPRLTERAFVVLPLLDLDPDPLLPDGRRLVELPAPPGAARPYAPPLALPR